MRSRCESCGRPIYDPYATHCSEQCIFESIKRAKKVVQEYPVRHRHHAVAS